MTSGTLPARLLNKISARQFAPKYVNLAHELLREISQQQLMPGDRLATENELINKHNISRVTVRQALELLASEGYISRHRARGTFVKRAVELDKQTTTLKGSILLISTNDQKSLRDDDLATLTVQRAMEQALSRRGFAVQILTFGQNSRENRERFTLHQSQPDLKGILTIGPCLEPHIEEMIRVPLVTSCTFHPSDHPWIGQDASQASKTSVAHLIEHGHRRIGMLCGAWVDIIGFGRFVEGFREAFRSHQLEFDRTLLIQACPEESLKELARQLLNRPDRPTAFFCENWLVCHAVIEAAESLGLSVPNDLSIVGYGRNVMEITSPCRITSYVPNSEGIGEAAADHLVQLIENKPSTETCFSIPGELIIQESVSPVTCPA